MSQHSVINAVFAFAGWFLGIAVLVVNPYSFAITLFVSGALFVVMAMSLADFRFHANKNKPLHRGVIAINTVAAVIVLIEMLFGSSTANLFLNLTIFLGFLLFDLFLGIDVWMHLKQSH